MDQCSSKLIKLVQTWSNMFKLDQTCSNLIKHVQTWSNGFKCIREELWDIKGCMSTSQILKAEIAFDQKYHLGQKCLIGQKCLFCQIWLFGKKLFFGQKWQWVRIELISYILARIVFKSEITFLPEMAFLPKTAFQPWLAFWPENAFWPKIRLSVLNLLFGQIWLKSLTFQSIERFGSPLMAESFQACLLPNFPRKKIECSLPAVMQL